MTRGHEILLIEDDPLLRREIGRALTRRGRMIVEASTGIAGLTQAAALQPQAALVDLGLPDISGVAVIAELRRALPRCAIVALSVFDDAHHVLAALRAGADGYITKTATTRAIDAALTAALDGEMSLSPTIARLVAEAALHAATTPPHAVPPIRSAGGLPTRTTLMPSAPPSARPTSPATPPTAPLPNAPRTHTSPQAPAAIQDLTKREIELLSELARGATYQQCAHALHITLGTVQTYIKSIYRKLDVASKVGALVVASERGLLGTALAAPSHGPHRAHADEDQAAS